jgi:hypothetical protein
MFLVKEIVVNIEVNVMVDDVFQDWYDCDDASDAPSWGCRALQTFS